MKHQLSLMEKLQSEYLKHEDRKKIFYFTKLLWLCKTLDFSLFQKEIDRDYIRKYNRLFSSYLTTELEDKEKAEELLNKMILETESDYPYVVEFRKRLDEHLEREGIDTSFDEMRWSPLTIGIEVMEQ